MQNEESRYIQRTEKEKKERKKTDWIGHILCRNCLLKRVIEGKVEGTCQRGRRHKQLLDEIKETSKTLEAERGSTRSHCLGNSPWKSRRTCSKANYGMNDMNE